MAQRKTHNPTNRKRLAQAGTLWECLNLQVLQDNWYGEALVRITVNDGVIQHVEAETKRHLRQPTL